MIIIMTNNNNNEMAPSRSDIRFTAYGILDTATPLITI